MGRTSPSKHGKGDTLEHHLLLSAALIGFGFGNSFLCSLVALGSTAGRGKAACLAFVGGRFAGIMLLGVVLGLFGWYLNISSKWMLLLFALLSLLFGVLVLAYPRALTRWRLLRHCEVGGCESCESHDHELPGQENHDCSSCGAARNCHQGSAENHSHHHAAHKFKSLTSSSIFSLGVVRGGTPCLKILLLLPLVLTLPFLEAMLLVAVFALSSTIYPIIGILAGNILGDAVSEKRMPQLTRAAAFLMIGLGAYYLYVFWVYSCDGGL